MNCESMRRRLLSGERPDFPYVDVKNHLAVCSPCRALQRQLVQAERNLPRLPVPSSSRAKADLLRQILITPAAPAEPMAPPLRLAYAAGRPPKERGLRKASLAAALTAAMVVFAFCWGMWPHDGPGPVPKPPVNSLVYRQNERDELLAAAHTPRERVERLAELAEKLHDEALALAKAADVDRLAVVAQFYDEVVRDNLRTYAGTLSEPERRELLPPIARRLSDTESELQRTAAEAGKAHTAAPLQQMAAVARDGDRWLQNLAQGRIS
jgi:hypothetical protein